MEVKNDLPKTRQFVTDWAWSPKLFLFYHTKYIRFKCGIVELNHFFQNKVKENKRAYDMFKGKEKTK